MKPFRSGVANTVATFPNDIPHLQDSLTVILSATPAPFETKREVPTSRQDERIFSPNRNQPKPKQHIGSAADMTRRVAPVS